MKNIKKFLISLIFTIIYLSILIKSSETNNKTEKETEESNKV